MNSSPAYRTEDGYIIPQLFCANLGVIGNIDEVAQQAPQEEIQEAVIVDDRPELKASQKMIDGIKAMNKTSMNGALYGAAIGLLAAMVFKKNKVLFTATGAVVGYAFGKSYYKTKTTNAKHFKVGE